MSVAKKDELEHVREWLRGVDYLPVLKTFVPAGVMTFPDIQRLVGFSTDVLTRILERLTQTVPGLADGRQVLKHLPDQPVIQGQRGRRPKLYRLEKLGARLLQAAGVADAKACGLSQPVEIAHALCFRAVAGAAQAAALAVTVDKPVAFGAGRNLRPDVVVAAPGRPRVIFEIEQRLLPQTLDRAVDKIQHLVDFFAMPEAEGYDRDIRFLFNLTEAQAPVTWRMWADVIAEVARARGPLPCRFWSAGLADFLEAPEWDGLRAFTTLMPAPEPEPAAGAPALALALVPVDPKALVPAALRPRGRLITAGDLVKVQAYVRVCRHEFEQAVAGPGPAFFRLIDLIYGVSHGYGQTYAQQFQVPWGSLFALRSYLELPDRRDLRAGLISRLAEYDRALHNGGMMMAAHYATRLIWDGFLRYHGVTRHPDLAIYVQPPFVDRTQSELRVVVDVRRSLWITRGTIDGLALYELVNEKALAWVLEAPFFYANELGLN
ncbi:MAG: hypothetical protein KA764_10070 [Anaerolineales bacterium]|nr:hypothetical protein [Anaerolineales bacterium]